MLSAWRMVRPRGVEAGPWQGQRRAAGGGKEPEPAGADGLLKLAAAAVDRRGSRCETTGRRRSGLPSEIARFVDGPRPRYQSRLSPLFELVEIVEPCVGQGI